MTLVANPRASHDTPRDPEYSGAAGLQKPDPVNAGDNKSDALAEDTRPEMGRADGGRDEFLNAQGDPAASENPIRAEQCSVPPLPPTPASEQDPTRVNRSATHKRSASTLTYSRAHTPELRAQLKVLKREMETLRQERGQMDELQHEIVRLKTEQTQVDELQSEVRSLREDCSRMEMMQMEVERLRRNQDRMEFLQQEVERLREEQQEMLWELQNLPPPDYEDRRSDGESLC
ncbi:hypothetical protein OE88DRAFT_1662369 [Heliocybe sulcata]|uniref:Uncharacterized protein n=1 Tax=Heliocybe sulcata TaxID=5364 RepID=A0A5C3MXI8_9AGAM|nr:hypothetical protein OE88DRAFT_1662369 [Heliocybe sulcata]